MAATAELQPLPRPAPPTLEERVDAAIARDREKLLARQRDAGGALKRAQAAYDKAVNHEQHAWGLFEDGRAPAERWQAAIDSADIAFAELQAARATRARIRDQLRELASPARRRRRLAGYERLDELHAREAAARA